MTLDISHSCPSYPFHGFDVSDVLPMSVRIRGVVTLEKGISWGDDGKVSAIRSKYRVCRAQFAEVTCFHCC